LASEGLTELWGKWRSVDQYHPLLCHMLDVARVAEQIYSAFDFLRTPSFASADNFRWSVFLAALHDLGKASPAVQLYPSFSPEEIEAVRKRLDRAGLHYPRLRDRRGATFRVLTPHGAITAAVLPKILTELYAVSFDTAQLLGRAAGAHHGRFATSRELTKITPQAAGDDSWRKLRVHIVRELAELLSVPKCPPRALDSAAAVALAGFISVADWIGSMEQYFAESTGGKIPH
jgi:CRISPR-associated endonuclease/helicase Cas3